MIDPEKLITPTIKTKKKEFNTKLAKNANTSPAAKDAITPRILTAPDKPLSIGLSLKM